MFVCDKSKQETYVAYVENLKAENRVSRERRQELMLRKWNQCIHRKDFLLSVPFYYQTTTIRPPSKSHVRLLKKI